VLATVPGSPSAIRVGTEQKALVGDTKRQANQPADSWQAKLGTVTVNPWVVRIWLDPSVPISSSGLQVSHLRSHSDMGQIIVKYCYWYITVYFRCIGHPIDSNELTHTPHNILKTTVNGASMIVGRVFWAILAATDYT